MERREAMAYIRDAARLGGGGGNAGVRGAPTPPLPPPAAAAPTAPPRPCSQTGGGHPPPRGRQRAPADSVTPLVARTPPSCLHPPTACTLPPPPCRPVGHPPGRPPSQQTCKPPGAAATAAWPPTEQPRRVQYRHTRRRVGRILDSGGQPDRPASRTSPAADQAGGRRVGGAAGKAVCTSHPLPPAAAGRPAADARRAAWRARRGGSCQPRRASAAPLPDRRRRPPSACHARPHVPSAAGAAPRRGWTRRHLRGRGSRRVLGGSAPLLPGCSWREDEHHDHCQLVTLENCSREPLAATRMQSGWWWAANLVVAGLDGNIPRAASRPAGGAGRPSGGAG